jgi:hypothetical protein
MSESVTHSRPLIRSASADHFAGGTTPIVSRMLAQSISSLHGLMERRRAKPIICSGLIGKQLASLKSWNNQTAPKVIREAVADPNTAVQSSDHSRILGAVFSSVIRQFASLLVKAAML